jgi:hypothetical protein
MKDTGPRRGASNRMNDDADEETRATPEYKELARLQRIVKEREEMEGDGIQVVHHGFKCDGCASEPILGVRVSCKICPEESPVDLCEECHGKGFVNGLCVAGLIWKIRIRLSMKWSGLRPVLLSLMLRH